MLCSSSFLPGTGSGRPVIDPVHATLAQAFRDRLCLLTAVSICCVLAGNPGFADDPAPNRPPAGPAARQDQRSETLLLKVEQQISAGHFIWPQDDNALQTWQLFMKNASPAEPATRQALAAFADHMHSRAIEEQTEGRSEISKALMSFDAMARAMLDSPAPPPPPDTSHTDAVSTAIASTIPTAASAGKPEARSPNEEAVPRPASPPANIALAMPTTPPAAQQPDAQQQALAAMYVARGNEKLAIKDISAARKIYEYAAGIGSAAAAMALARTYDPAWLAENGAIGVRPDQAQAVAWYRKASVLGDPNARVRLQALGAADAN